MSGKCSKRNKPQPLRPSGSNCQPWRFYAEGLDQLHIVHDRERSENLLDRTQFASCIALGAAIENIDLATLELTEAEAAAMRVLARPDVAAMLRQWQLGSAL